MFPLPSALEAHLPHVPQFDYRNLSSLIYVQLSWRTRSMIVRKLEQNFSGSCSLVSYLQSRKLPIRGAYET